MKHPRPARLPQSKRMAVTNGILAIVLMINVLQLWLFTATMNAYLGGDYAVLVPAALVSLFCLALVGGLLWYLYGLER